MSMPLSRDPVVAKDYPNAKLLYTILKQFELRHVDWDKVASELGISNGHAARMRYTRFKQEMENIRPAPRRPVGPGKVTKEPRPRGRPPGRKNKTKPDSIGCLFKDNGLPTAVDRIVVDVIREEAPAPIKIEAGNDYDSKPSIIKPRNPTSGTATPEPRPTVKTEADNDTSSLPYLSVEGAVHSPIVIPDDPSPFRATADEMDFESLGELWTRDWDDELDAHFDLYEELMDNANL